MPTWLYAAILVASMVASMVSQTMFVAQMAFYNRVSDPAIGGTYMTMLNTSAHEATRATHGGSTGAARDA